MAIMLLILMFGSMILFECGYGKLIKPILIVMGLVIFGVLFLGPALGPGLTGIN